jgi:hypothetical protein
MVPVAGLGATHCVAAGTRPNLFDTGCTGIPQLVLWAAPLPALSLYAFLLANQAVLERGAAYCEQLEEELEHELAPCSAPNALLVPRGMRDVTDPSYSKAPYMFAAVASQLGMAIIAGGYTLASVAAMPWSRHNEWITIVTAALYGLVSVLLLICGINIASLHTARGRFEPARKPA